MSASTGDKITDTRNAARPNSARVSSSRSAGGTTLACDSLSGWPTASKVHFVTYKIDSTSAVVAGTQLDCYGIVSGNNIGSFTVVDGTDTGNAVNDVVEMIPTAGWGQDLADGLTAQHSRTGTHTAITATSLTATGAVTGTGGTLTSSTLASPTISGTLTGAVVKNANLATTSGELGAAWQSFTPTWTNLTVGSGTNEGYYTQVGKTVFFKIRFVYGAGSAVGSNVYVNPPVAFASTVPVHAHIATGTLVAAGLNYPGWFWNDNGSRLQVLYASTATSPATYAGTSSSLPGVWTTNDVIHMTGFYEAA